MCVARNNNTGTRIPAEMGKGIFAGSSACRLLLQMHRRRGKKMSASTNNKRRLTDYFEWIANATAGIVQEAANPDYMELEN